MVQYEKTSSDGGNYLAHVHFYFMIRYVIEKMYPPRRQEKTLFRFYATQKVFARPILIRPPVKINFASSLIQVYPAHPIAHGLYQQVCLLNSGCSGGRATKAGSAETDLFPLPRTNFTG